MQWNPTSYASFASFVPELGEPLLDLLRAQPGELVLDLGCGDGALTARIVESGARVIGIDSSSEMLAVARARGLDVRLADGSAFELPMRFDAVFSNAAIHWIPDHDSLVAAVARHLRRGGRFVGELGGHGNVAAILTAIVAVLGQRGIDWRTRHPWRFPTESEWQSCLERHGFAVQGLTLFARPTPMPAGMRGWLETFAGAYLEGMNPDERDAVLDEVTSLTAPALQDASGAWTGDYVRLRFAATLK